MSIEPWISWLRRLGLSLAIVTVAISLMPLVASADVGEVVDTATETTGNVVDTATETTGNVVDTAAETTGNVVDTAGGMVSAGSASVNGGTLGDDSKSGSRSGPSTATANVGPGDRIGRTSSSGSHPRWLVRTDAYEREHLSVIGYQSGAGSGGQEPTMDPCNLDQRLVCLGVLFGLGEFADTGAEVLGDVLANTGVGVTALMALTTLLLIAGSAALAASSRRIGVVTRTG